MSAWDQAGLIVMVALFGTQIAAVIRDPRSSSAWAWLCVVTLFIGLSLVEAVAR